MACNGSELSIWDLEQRQKQYQAKGNKPNRIGLVDKPWNTAVAFLPGSDGQKVVVGTAYHKLRVYDVKSKRPALDMQFGEAKITALAPQSNGQCFGFCFDVQVLELVLLLVIRKMLYNQYQWCRVLLPFACDSPVI